MLKINKKQNTFSKIFIFIFALSLFANCSVIRKNNVEEEKKEKKVEIKAFKDENFYLLLALDQQLNENFEESAENFLKLYKKTDNKYYLHEYVSILNYAGNYDKLITFVQKNRFKEHFKDTKIKLELVKAYASSGQDEEAIDFLIEIAEKEPSENNYKLLAELYFRIKNYEQALFYLQKAYKLHNSPEVMESIAKVLSTFLGQKNEAIKNLETHTRIYGCNLKLCISLANIYGDLGNLDEMLRIYQSLFDQNIENKAVYAQKIIDILKYKNDYGSLELFLEKTNFDNDLLLQIYSVQKKYKKGFDFAKKLFESTGNLRYLAQNAVFEYELNKTSKNKAYLKSIVEKLKEVVSELKDPLYLNYLGYLMIDHDIDLRDGISYVKEALVLKPDSVFYIDSLAWGYYKLGHCKIAYIEMKKVVEELGLTDQEIISHWRAIEKCSKQKQAEK
jgi:tetratricopeptide (TPR) repeat protein